MKVATRTFLCTALLLGTLVSCRRSQDAASLPMDTIKPAGDQSLVKSADSAKDTTQAKQDTASAPKSDLPPMAKAIEPDRLAQYLPKMPGWTPSGELIKELNIHDNFNKSRVAQTYTQGGKKVTVEINDFAYIPYLYEPWAKFNGNYLDDDNFARTETTTMSGYHAVQSMEKKDPHGTVTVFPGKRYVVTVTGDGITDINEIRSIAQSVDLKGLENLQ